MKKYLLVMSLCLSVSLWGETKVLVDAIPTGATFGGVTPIGLPFKNAGDEDPKKIEAGLNQAVGGILPGAAQQGFSYICLLSAPGDQPIAVPIAAGKAELKLRRTDTVVLVLFYRGGHEAPSRIDYSTGSPEAKTAHVSSTFKKIAVPAGGSTAGWIYFNLPRIQAEAEKEKSPVVFLSASGDGAAVPVPIPGMKEPLMVPDDRSIFNATWYLDPAKASTPRTEMLGHAVPAEDSKKTP